MSVEELRTRFDAIMGDRATPELFDALVRTHEDLASEDGASLEDAVALILNVWSSLEAGRKA